MSAMLFSAWPAVLWIGGRRRTEGGETGKARDKDEQEREMPEEEVSQEVEGEGKGRDFIWTVISEERVTGWQKINGNWYYFDEEGWMPTGWLEDGGKRYRVKDNGVMQTGWILEQKRVVFCGWYGSDAVTGWLHKGRSWFLSARKTGRCVPDGKILVERGIVFVPGKR